MAARGAELAGVFPCFEVVFATVGRFPGEVVHLTLGSRLDGETADRLIELAALLLPFGCTVDRPTLLVEDDAGQWTVDRSGRCRPPARADLPSVRSSGDAA